RPAQHVLAVAMADEVGQVRVAAGKLLDRDRAVRTELAIDERGEPIERELFARAHRDRVAHGAYRPRIRLATTILWTSSGPSSILRREMWRHVVSNTRSQIPIQRMQW